MPSYIVIKILAAVEFRVIDNNRYVKKPGETFFNLWLIKNGSVRCFDQNLNYVSTLEEGSFFGEFNVLFDMYSTMYYQAYCETSVESTVNLFAIDYAMLLDALT